MNFQFIRITDKTRAEALNLHIAPNQAGTVETVAECLAEAEQFSLWRPVMIRAEAGENTGLAMAGETIGFAMYGLWINEGEGGRVWLDRFFIDERYQGKGLAKACLPCLIRHIHTEYNRPLLFLSVYKDNLPAIRLYKKLGFTFNGELDINGERVMTLRL